MKTNYNITEQCKECTHIVEDICEVWMSPNAKWALGQCPTDTKFRQVIVEQTKTKNPLKASKKKAKGR